MKSFFSAFLLFTAFTLAQAQPTLPDWARSAVWYQIFPERFYNGDPSNDPTVSRVEQQPAGWQKSVWTNDWYAREPWEEAFHPEFHWSVTKRRYGGDLEGVIRKLDYLQDLGITAIYLNPVFDALSMHKYDGASLHHVDPNFGPDPDGDRATINAEGVLEGGSWRFTEADRLLLKLIEEAHKRNIRIVLDGVFNHTGREFWAFNDVVRDQAASPYAEWFSIEKFDNPKTPENEFDYKGWIGIKALPAFRQEKGNLVPPVKEYIFAITRRWMDPNGDGDPTDGIDGWRLDVASEIGLPFWKEWHDVVRRLNPEAITIAEVWDDKARPYTLYGGFNAVMNYRWLRHVDDFFVTRKTTADQFSSALKDLLADLKPDANFGAYNMLESHDTERFSSRFMNIDRAFKENSKADQGFSVRKPDDPAWNRFKLAVFFQFTYVGMPALYYGAEAGMWGADDPDNRKPMLWKELTYQPEKQHPSKLFRDADSVLYNDDIAAFYKQMTGMRRNDPVLQSGSIFFLTQTSYTSTVAFLRTLDYEAVRLVVINTDSAKTATVELPRTLRIETQKSRFGRLKLNKRRNHVMIPPLTADIIEVVRK
jgi:glycosidase